MNNEDKILLMLEGLTTDMAELKQDVAELKHRMTNVENELQEVKRSVILIENDHGSRITALFDGYSLNNDILQEVRAEIHKITAHQQRQDMSIYVLESERQG